MLRPELPRFLAPRTTKARSNYHNSDSAPLSLERQSVLKVRIEKTITHLCWKYVLLLAQPVRKPRKAADPFRSLQNALQQCGRGGENRQLSFLRQPFLCSMISYPMSHEITSRFLLTAALECRGAHRSLLAMQHSQRGPLLHAGDENSSIAAGARVAPAGERKQA